MEGAEIMAGSNLRIGMRREMAFGVVLAMTAIMALVEVMAVFKLDGNDAQERSMGSTARLSLSA